MAEAAALQKPVLCVDPCPGMLPQASKHPNVKPLLMDAVRFAQLPPEQIYTYALMQVST